MGFDDIDKKHRPKAPGIRDTFLRPVGEPKCEPEAVCDKCEGGGWEHYGLGWGDPHFRVCTKCENPEGLPCP